MTLAKSESINENVLAWATGAKRGEMMKTKEAPPKKMLKNIAFLVLFEKNRLTFEEDGVL